MSEPTIYLTKDSDGNVCIFRKLPIYNADGDWEPIGDDDEFIECGAISWPEIAPASCHKFTSVEVDERELVCPWCQNTGTVLADFDHPQWVACSCVHAPQDCGEEAAE